MSFNNLLLAVALTVLWPLVLMGVLAAAEWLERRTLTAREIGPRGPRPAASAPPEPVPAATGATAGVAAADAGTAEDAGRPASSWAVAGRGGPGGSPDGARAGGRHLRRAGGGRHERRG
jgi:hypothetical protein